MQGTKWGSVVAGLLLGLANITAGAQQTEVRRFNLYTGFVDFYTPGLNGIHQRGFHVQGGVRLNRWLSGGVDYSVGTGSTNLTPDLTTAAIQQRLGLLFAASHVPASYKLAIPTDTNLQTFTAGGEVSYRHFRRVTLFARPALSAFRLRAVPKPTDAISTAVAGFLVPKGYKLDWVGAYGVGGGADFNVTKALAIRAQYDGAWNHPYNDILANGGWTNRFSIGTSFNFGRNILAPSRTSASVNARRDGL
ncbi:hypothetical protein [Terriglobus sp.]|uniref:hypothetical protein n=1 Tax=Terriglobus sp. TaxID=1889013 RepID=UPI003B00ABD4